MPELAVSIPTPRGFHLRTAVFSHGWFDLPPFHWSPTDHVLGTLTHMSRSIVRLGIAQPRSGRLAVEAKWAARSKGPSADQVTQRVRSMFNLDLDVDEFYALAGDLYRWAHKRRAGPLLRSGSVFEDAVKMLATTNCSWALTKNMMTRLVGAIGSPGPGGGRAFPTPSQMARQPLSFYAETVRAGYRARYFLAFARDVDEGRIDPERWLSHTGETSDLIKLIRQSPGFGKYAAENIARLLGRFDGLALDSWCLNKFPQVHGPVKGDVGRAIERRYRPFGKWSGLALWLDLTRDWHELDESDKPSFNLKQT